MENKGQIRSLEGGDRRDILYEIRTENLIVFLTSNSLIYQYYKFEGDASFPDGWSFDISSRHRKTPMTLKTERVEVVLSGINRNVEIKNGKQSSYFENYYNVPSHPEGIVDVHGYDSILYKDIYPGIDWLVYVKSGKLKYDFIVSPSGNSADIKMKINGIRLPVLQSNGSLKMSTGMGDIVDSAPIAYEQRSGKKVPARFRLRGNELGFVAGPSSGTLVLDPAITWGTYYGDGYSRGEDCAADHQDGILLAGCTTSITGISSGGFQNTYGGGGSNPWGDALLVKFDSSGARLWATYYGAEDDDRAISCAVDGSDNIYIAGGSYSTLGGMASGGFQNNFGGSASDAFLAKFAPDGTRLWATYYGGTELDFGSCCAIDKDDNIYLTGETGSLGMAYNGFKNFRESTECFLVKFDAAGSRIWATYFGGPDSDVSLACEADRDGNIYIGGATASETGIAFNGFQSVTFGPFFSNPYEGFLAKLDSAGDLKWGTYYGGSGYEFVNSITTDGCNNVFIAGVTESTFGIAGNGFVNTKIDPTNNLYGNNSFLAKFTPEGSRYWGTYCTLDGIGSCTADSSGNVYLVCNTFESAGIASGGFQNLFGGWYDGVVIKYNSGGNRIWSSFYGGQEIDGITACAIDEHNNLYLTGVTMSPTGIAFNGFQNSPGSGFAGLGNAFLCRVKDTGVFLNPVVLNIHVSSSDSICFGTPVTFLAEALNSGNLVNYRWKKNGINVGGDSATYVDSFLIAGDIVHCELRIFLTCSDTTIIVSNDLSIPVKPIPKADFLVKDNGCLAEIIVVDLVSNAIPGTEFSWTFAGADVISGSGAGPYSLRWNQSGEKLISLHVSLNDCEAWHDERIQIHSNPEVQIASLSAPVVCAGSDVRLKAIVTDTSLSFAWRKGADLFPDVADYIEMPVTGSVLVSLVATDVYGCVGQDSLSILTEHCCEAYLPDAFTPNGDQKNDVFRLISSAAPEGLTLKIVNRWGQVIHETTDLTAGWDGTLKGVLQPVGTYFYFLKYRCSGGKVLEKKGSFTLLR